MSSTWGWLSAVIGDGSSIARSVITGATTATVASRVTSRRTTREKARGYVATARTAADGFHYIATHVDSYDRTAMTRHVGDLYGQLDAVWNALPKALRQVTANAARRHRLGQTLRAVRTPLYAYKLLVDDAVAAKKLDVKAEADLRRQVQNVCAAVDALVKA